MVFDRKRSLDGKRQELPCGQCIGCRLDRARQWAIRCAHEAQLHDDNYFITLTYNDKNLPFSLNHAHWQAFMKKLRKTKNGDDIRFMMCGEYSELGRPHYHACLFNYSLDDLVHIKNNKYGDKLYTSETLTKLWPFGFHWIGHVTYNSAGYVSRYITKKITGDAADDVYKGRIPPYLQSSLRPGIGKEWFEKYYNEVFPRDYVVIEGKKKPVPAYYDKLYERMFPDKMQEIKQKRTLDRQINDQYSCDKRKWAREDNTIARVTLRRN